MPEETMPEEQDTPALCPHCDGEMIQHAGQEFCPACLMQQGMRSSTLGGPRVIWTPPTVEELAGRFPGLEIHTLLGQGGMGAVYRVRQIELDRIAALKILPEQFAQEPGFSERFLREARLLASLSHPHIVTVYEFGQREGTYFLLMEFVDGVTLRQALRSEPIHRLDPREALTVVGQLCDALQFAHDEGVIHRDIKPENILIDKRGRVKIADFGLARMLGKSAGMLTLTGTNQLMGTPVYMAPEQIEGTGSVDHRVDIYSMGVVFYELLTGELPIGRFSPPSRRTELDKGLDEVVLRALEKEPDRRYQQASEVRTAVAPYSATSTPPSAAEPIHRRLGGSVRTFAAFAAGVVFVLALPVLVHWLEALSFNRGRKAINDAIVENRPAPPRAALPQQYTGDPGMGMDGPDDLGSGAFGMMATPSDSGFGMMGDMMEGGDSGYGAEEEAVPEDMSDMGGTGMGYSEGGEMAAGDFDAGGGIGEGMPGNRGAEAGVGSDPLGTGSDMGGMGSGFPGMSGGSGLGSGGMGMGMGMAGGSGGGESLSAEEAPPLLSIDADQVTVEQSWFSEPHEDLIELDAILTEFHHRYLQLERLSSTVARTEDGVVTLIAVQQQQQQQLINAMWTRLDDTVSRTHQRELRDKLPLYGLPRPPAHGYPGAGGGSSGSAGGYPGGFAGGGSGMGSSSGESAWLPGLFGWSPELAPALVEVGREGRWFTWSVSLNDLGATVGREPDLPAALARFDREFSPSLALDNLRAAAHQIYSSPQGEHSQQAREQIGDRLTHRGRIALAMSILAGEDLAIGDEDEQDQSGGAPMQAAPLPVTTDPLPRRRENLLSRWPTVRTAEDLAIRVDLLDLLSLAMNEAASIQWLSECLAVSNNQPAALRVLREERVIEDQGDSTATGWLNTGSPQQARVRLKLGDDSWRVDELILAPGIAVGTGTTDEAGAAVSPQE